MKNILNNDSISDIFEGNLAKLADVDEKSESPIHTRYDSNCIPDRKTILENEKIDKIKNKMPLSTKNLNKYSTFDKLKLN